MKRFALAVACLAAIGTIVLVIKPKRAPVAPPMFAGTETCAGCHQQAFADWQQSHHRRAMEVADSKSVLGDFNDAVSVNFGIRSRFFMRDGKYLVETDDAQGNLATFPIAYTFGFFPLQQYLIEFPDGRLQALSISWDSRPAADGGQRWFHLYPDAQITHENPLHWTGAFQNWNSRCAACHSTHVVRNYAAATNTYATRWQELNVGCEACHGPGSRHVAWAAGTKSLPGKGLLFNLTKSWEPAAGRLPIPQSAPSTLSAQLQVCAGCHSRRAELQQTDPAADFFTNYSLSPLLESLYFPDGQIHEEVYELGSFLQSRMHQNHVSCTNCHEPHSNRLRARGNGLCLQCHEPQKFQQKDHFFHEVDSPGAQCVNCHMPQRTYMGVDARHDHSFRIPDPLASLRLGVPNACTQCHANRDDQWAAEFLTRRTGGTEPRYPQAALLAAARNGESVVVADLLAFANESNRPPLLRSIALLESGRFPSTQQQRAVREAMRSPDPVVRMGAASALGAIDPGQRLMLLEPLLQDPSKAVRHVVARALSELPLMQAPEPNRAALGKLFAEYQQTLLHNADLPESMSDLGLFHSAQGNPDAAEQALRQARRLAPRYLPAMLNLADLHRARGRDDLGEPLLREAVDAWPESGDARHQLGLLHVRTGRTLQSVEFLRQAMQLSPDNARYALVYAVALFETGSTTQGLAVLETARRRFPDDVAIQQALDGYRFAQP